MSTPYALYTWAQLEAKMREQFPLTQLGSDPMNDRYCAATRGWVGGPFSKYFGEYLTARGDLKWRKRGNQCEHFALRAALEAVQLFSQADDPNIPAEAESLAVAACKYKSDTLGWHEVNLWFLDEMWVPWEPQTRAFFEFSEVERFTVQKPIIP